MTLSFVLVGFGQLVKDRLLPNLIKVVEEIDKEELYRLYKIKKIDLYVLVKNIEKATKYYDKIKQNDKIDAVFLDAENQKEIENLIEKMKEYEYKYVYIASPNETHVRYIKLFIPVADRIFVEKPICEHFDEIKPLLEELGEDDKNKIRMIDHYLYKEPLRELLINFTKYYHLIGEIDKIKFYLLEKDPIEEERQWLYLTGTVRDFFSHFLSIIFKLSELYPKIIKTKPVKILSVKKARYNLDKLDYDVKISEKDMLETYAEIKLKINDLMAQVFIGRGVDVDRKQLIIEGDKGDLIIDILQGRSYFKTNGKEVTLFSKKDPSKGEYYYILKEILTRERSVGISLDLAVFEVRIFDAIDKYDTSKTYKLGTRPKFLI